MTPSWCYSRGNAIDSDHVAGRQDVAIHFADTVDLCSPLV